eukprot:12443469-Ditylum_brightwellii.AAC.1
MHPYVALVCLPACGKVKVLYRLGFECSGTGKTTGADGKLLAVISKGGGELGPPHLVVLESTMLTPKPIICPQATVFNQQKQQDMNWPMFLATNIAAST